MSPGGRRSLPTWLIAAVLTVYPPVLRDRYGPEIADLLRESRRPWHDLTNVAWNALLERGGSVRGSLRGAPLRPYAARVGALLFAPLLFWTTLLMATPVTAILAGVFGSLIGQGYVRYGGPEEGLQMGSDDGGMIAAETVVVAAIATLGTLVAKEWRAALRIPAPAVVVPAMLVLGSAGIALSFVTFNAVMGGGSGGRVPEWATVSVSGSVWWALLTASVVRYRTLTGQGRTTAARRVAVAATVATAVVCVGIHVLAQGRDLWIGLLTMSFPAQAIVCTPFAFALMRVARRQEVMEAG